MLACLSFFHISTKTIPLRLFQSVLPVVAVVGLCVCFVLFCGGKQSKEGYLKDTWFTGGVITSQMCLFDLKASALPPFTSSMCWASVPWNTCFECAQFSFSSVSHPGFEHGHPATHCDQGGDPWPRSLHCRNMCSCYWLYWHHREPPGSLCILQVFPSQLIWLALQLVCACGQMFCIDFLLD